MAQSRENFGGRTAAIFALAGSAIGLGNIWRFPFLVGQNGGAAFIIIYLIAALVLCAPIFLAESIIGRRTQLSTFSALSSLAPRTGWKWLGLLTLLTPIIILGFYCVVGGWSLEYLAKALGFRFSTQALTCEDCTALFASFTSSPVRHLVCFTIYLALNALIITLGVTKGIEKFSKITTPLLFVLIIVVMVYSISLPGAEAGIRYIIRPDWSKVTASTALSAVGQAFFSLSLGVGAVLTYSSYIRKEDNLVSTTIWTVLFDLSFALMAGFAIMPAVFAAGMEPGAGPGLIFETLPYIFSSMSAQAPVFSGIVAILFFLTIFFAAFSSSISVLEVGVAFLVDSKGMSRGKASALLFCICWVLGIFCALSFGPLREVNILGLGIFDFCDKLTSDILMIFGSLLFVIFVGWKMKKSDVMDEFTGGGRYRGNEKLFKVFYFLVRFVAPVVIIAVLLSSLLL